MHPTLTCICLGRARHAHVINSRLRKLASSPRSKESCELASKATPASRCSEQLLLQQEEGGTMGVGKVLNDVKPYLAMVLLQVGFSGMYIVSVASLRRGMSHYVLVVYRNLVATVVMAPFALLFERGVRPKMTVTIFLKIMGLALLEPGLDQNLYYLGAKLTSAGFASALVNILPAVTFLTAVLLRMEKVRLRSLHSQAKIVGTACTVAGAVLMIIYHGPVVQFPWSRGHGHTAAAAVAATAASQSSASWLNGSIMVIVSCVCWSAFFILQSNTLQSYPAELSLTTLICVLGSAMSGAVALVAERHDMGAWAIGFDTRLFTAVYSGIVCSGVAYYVQGLVTQARGPVFVTAFQPLSMIITVVMGSIILKEEITLGSVIGAAIIVLGLYSLIWGKSEDHLDKAAAVANGVATELPLTSMANGNGNGKHVLGGHVTDVETPAVNCAH
ncbi:WAT1-related protein At1g44800-like [Phragmites australis]|uniref:WAT1-related protein At1g44800-like n=1 Tax=Phragmites australis TaxID=29695 RepID=UPI002D789D03|nr:WAT1-related protein At1g44800-like [Phragmites australis]